MSERPEARRAATGMGIATAASRSIGFVRVLVVAAVLGTTYLGNAYQSTNSVSNVLFELIAAGALSAVLVPTFVDLLDRDDTARAEHLAGRLLGLALVVLGVVSVVGIVCAPRISELLTRGVTEADKAAQQQELSTLLLRWFIPQVMLYAVGAVAVAILYAKRKLAVTAIAPVGYTIVTVVTMVVFRAVTGPDPTVDLTSGEALILAVGGTLGVAAFVGIPTVAVWRSGFRLVPRLGRHDEDVRRVVRLSGWAVFQHTMVGLLLAAAIVVGNSVKGGTVAYQVAFVFFLAPYAILAQPVHTAILSDLAREAGEPSAFARSLRWALDNMVLLVVPVSVLLMALAYPMMRVVAFGGAAKGDGAQLLAAGLASLALGLVAYSAFLLFARAYYALGNSRVPALAALVSGVLGVVVMVGGGRAFDGGATVGMLGIGHSVAYFAGAIVLGVGLRRRTGESTWPSALLPAVAVAAPVGVVCWLVGVVVEPSSRLLTALLVGGLAVAGGAVYLVGLRLVRKQPLPRPRRSRTRDLEPADAALEP
ncbi:MAG: lipid II flippase MurJ [Acidimicrobiia bacterium]